MSFLDRVAGAPISWGVCEVPGWGVQLPAERVLSEMRDVEEWQVVLSKKDDDPLGLDQLEVRIAAREGTSVEELKKSIWSELQAATEVAPNGVTVHPTPSSVVGSIVAAAEGACGRGLGDELEDERSRRWRKESKEEHDGDL